MVEIEAFSKLASRGCSVEARRQQRQAYGRPDDVEVSAMLRLRMRRWDDRSFGTLLERWNSDARPGTA